MYNVVNDIKKNDWYTGPIYATTAPTRPTGNNNKCLNREVFTRKMLDDKWFLDVRCLFLDFIFTRVSTSASNDNCHFVPLKHEFFLNRTVGNWKNSPTPTSMLIC